MSPDDTDEVERLADALAERLTLASVGTIPAELLGALNPSGRQQTYSLYDVRRPTDQVLVDFTGRADHLEVALSMNGGQCRTVFRYYAPPAAA